MRDLELRSNGFSNAISLLQVTRARASPPVANHLKVRQPYNEHPTDISQFSVLSAHRVPNTNIKFANRSLQPVKGSNCEPATGKLLENRRTEHSLQNESQNSNGRDRIEHRLVQIKDLQEKSKKIDLVRITVQNT